MKEQTNYVLQSTLAVILFIIILAVAVGIANYWVKHDTGYVISGIRVYVGTSIFFILLGLQNAYFATKILISGWFKYVLFTLIVVIHIFVGSYFVSFLR